PAASRLCPTRTAGSPRGAVCPLRAQCAVLWHAFPVSGEHAPWGGWTLPPRAGGHPGRGQDPPPQDSAPAHRAPATSGRGATQMQKRTYLGLGLGLLLLGLSGAGPAQAAPPAPAPGGPQPPAPRVPNAFDGNGVSDLLVYTHATGEVRIGYLDTTGTLNWVSLVTGVPPETITAVADFNGDGKA